MGWNSWNSGITLTESSVEETIEAMVRSGMRDAGYRYVNLDAGWAAVSRDRDGNLQADPGRFPSGMSAVAQYAHQRGMYLGLYASPGYEMCGLGRANASAGHESDDARTFARWEIDFLKYDWCSTDTDRADQVARFAAMRDALRDSGRRILYSINPTTSLDPGAGLAYDWSSIADMSRIALDLVPIWRSAPGDYVRGVTDLITAASSVAPRTRPGYWNDPDMLVAGISWPQFVTSHPGMAASLAIPGTVHLGPGSSDVVSVISDQRQSLTTEEQQAHLTLWAILAAPLLAGNDIRSMPEQTREILTNPDMIAVDQDPLVSQGRPLSDDPRILVKLLSDGSVAIAAVNAAADPVTITTSAAVIGLPVQSCYTVRDLWAHTDRASPGGTIAALVPARATTALRIYPACH